MVVQWAHAPVVLVRILLLVILLYIVNTWWNGRHAGPKIQSFSEGVGSSPIVPKVHIF